jgi:hypothetical protein
VAAVQGRNDRRGPESGCSERDDQDTPEAKEHRHQADQESSRKAHDNGVAHPEYQIQREAAQLARSGGSSRPVATSYSDLAQVLSDNGELLFCELPDGTRGTWPAWMTNAGAKAT